MSSKAKKMSQTLAETAPNNTRTVPFKVLFNIDGHKEYTVVYVTGVPEDIEDDDPTIKHAAEQQFVNSLNGRMYLEMYAPEQDHRKDYPTFQNMMKADSVTVTGVERIA